MRLKELLKYDDIVIQCHDNPDADTIASGYAVYCFLKAYGKNSKLIYSGRNTIRKSNLKLMVSELHIPITHVEKLDEPELLVTVDCQYGESNVTMHKAKNIAVIDHHRISGKVPELHEIRNKFGSCSTVLWHMLKEEDFAINSDIRLSTALYYGLYTDTNEFTEISNTMDMGLRDEVEVDHVLIGRLRNANMSLEELEIAGTALLKSDYIEDYRCAIVKAGMCDPNVLGIISDLLLAVDVVDTCLVFNVLPNGVKLSVRSCVENVKASELATVICDGIGSGGGHMNKAGGFIQMELLIPEYIKFCEKMGITPRMRLSDDERKEIPTDSAVKTLLEKRMLDYLEKNKNESSKEAVIFDLDGTLLNTLEDLCDAVNVALEINGMPKRTLEEVRNFVGNGVRNLMLRAVENGEDNPLFEKAFADFKKYYALHCKDKTVPYRGIIELLEVLQNRGIKMAIVSNKIDSAVKELNNFYFSEYTKTAIGEMEGVARKPAPDTALKALRELGVSADKAIYVGDSDVDIKTARNAGLDCVSVTWGFRDRDFLIENGATRLIDYPLQLLQYLEK